MYKIIILASALLAGCVSTGPLVKPEQVVANHVEYVIKVPPAESMKLPDALPKLDVDTAKQSDIARWIVASEGRTKQLEDQIISIASFFTAEQSKLDADAVTKNKQADADANQKQADNAAAAISKTVIK